MNPLRFVRKPSPPAKTGVSPTRFLSSAPQAPLPPVAPQRTRKEELAQEAKKSPRFVTIVAPGAKGEGGNFRLAYHPDANLKAYLAQAGLLQMIGKRSFYDQTQPDKGKIRLSYILQPGSIIVLYPPNVSPASHLQKSDVSAEEIARKLTSGPKEKVVSMSYDNVEEA